MTARLLPPPARRASRAARAGALVFFVLCLAVGVAAVVAVAGFSERAARRRCAPRRGSLLAADLRVEGLRAARPSLEAELLARRSRRCASSRLCARCRRCAAARSGERAAPARSQLVELRAVDGDYPFYGELELEPARPLAELLAGDGAVAAPELATRARPRARRSALGRRAALRPARPGALRARPDRRRLRARPAPLRLRREPARATGLVALGSRVEHRTLVRAARRLRPAAADRARGPRCARRSRIPPSTASRPSPRVSRSCARGVDRTERFLGLVALLSLVVGGIGVAQTVRAWLATRLDAIAVWKALGARPREIALLYLAQTVLLGARRQRRRRSRSASRSSASCRRSLAATSSRICPLPALSAARGAPRPGARQSASRCSSRCRRSSPRCAFRRARVLRRDVEPLPAPRASRLGARARRSSPGVGAVAARAGAVARLGARLRRRARGDGRAPRGSPRALLVAGARRLPRLSAADARCAGASRRSGAPARGTLGERGRARSRARSSSSAWRPSSATWRSGA